MAKGISQPGQIHLRIIEVMKRFPEGTSGGQIRQELEEERLPAKDLCDLDRRINELGEWFIIERTVIAQNVLGKRRNALNEAQISPNLRAQVLYLACGRCQRCGETIKAHGITLIVDRKEPKGRISIDGRDNLWAICEACHAVKKSGFPHPTFGVRPRLERCQTSILRRETHI